ncbi:hypothetical protein HanRHA438_Chr08g0370001 [Helianthus annuus]|uniref:Uncharacterized protein n=1 Tax=Helianthus annuus TaxID=4232 RepID=A0A9K3NE79_HELAN|nr:hypothetical protein HanXRQr2_Chr08g0357901 [Helianthus annuus]KAJ0540201.1 hypothetical protein HanHA300_Chr08g0295531 [Helianthus annuus]KAJ0548672.1 hypothetical protein HanIR_Chr08g0386411 [Helianthus annuus]KAJ0554945.1 hypothetical protein HanHA89_Chr08g0314041 [Helianthus annuus]KAJ0720512.1 hypothetical protein HanLR1_Chr08g0294391 [Helianthus annuus]
MLSCRQEYEIKNGGFGHGKLKAINVGAVDVDLDEDKEAFGNTQDLVDCIEKRVTMMAALRVKIETHLGARLIEEPKNTVFLGLKRRYVEVLDDEPIWPPEGLDNFAEGQMFIQASPTGIAKTPSHGGFSTKRVSENVTNLMLEEVASKTIAQILVELNAYSAEKACACKKKRDHSED